MATVAECAERIATIEWWRVRNCIRLGKISGEQFRVRLIAARRARLELLNCWVNKKLR